MDLNDLLQDPEKIKQFIGVLQSFLDKEEDPEQPSNLAQTNSRTVETKPNNRRQSRQKQSNTNTNKFESMPEFRMHKADVIIDKQLCQHPPVDRGRDFDLLDVVCRICGRKESVPPALVFEGVARYKCNNCSTKSG